MKPCILHVGMPKTGTTSIQESLYFGLEDPTFRYVGLGRVNAATHLPLLCSEQPEDYWLFRLGGYSKTRIRAMRGTYVRRLRRALRRAGERSCTPIISDENCWYFPPSDLERLRCFLVAEGFEVRVIAYIRPIKSYTESLFQQQSKWGFHEFDPLSRFRSHGDQALRSWSCTLENFGQIFGLRNVIVRSFVRSSLVDGCAVRDFCHTLGISLTPQAVIRSNESLSADAVRFLYAYNRFTCPGTQPSFLSRRLLIAHFEDLEGEPFRFHSDVFTPMAEAIAAEERQMCDRYGIDIAEDLGAADAGPCVRVETDLFRYSQASLDWLAEASRSKPIKSDEGESMGRAVASQVDRIRRHPSWRRCREFVAGRFRTDLRWIRHGD